MIFFDILSAIGGIFTLIYVVLCWLVTAVKVYQGFKPVGYRKYVSKRIPAGKWPIWSFIGKIHAIFISPIAYIVVSVAGSMNDLYSENTS